MKSNILCPKDLEVIFLQRFLSRHNYPQVTPLQRILFFYYTCTCNEILILKVDTMETKKIKSMDEKLLAIVDFGKEKKLYLVDPSDIQSFLVYDPIAFQSQLNSLWTDKSMFNPSNN
jgi:hypothetical protein